MSQADYFVGLAAAGAGQSLCDAASLGLICIGTDKLVYHRMLCPPANLADSLTDAIERCLAIARSADTTRRIRQYQDKQIAVEMQARPLKRLIAHVR